MPVNFWHTSLRFWFFLSYLITAVSPESIPPTTIKHDLHYPNSAHIYVLGRICGDQCVRELPHGWRTTCHCNSTESFDRHQGVYCCSNSPCVQNDNGDVTCSSGKKLEFHQKCAKSCPISWSSISLASSCPEQERCLDGDKFSKICLRESYTTENLNRILTPRGDRVKCEPSVHSPDYVLEQSYLS